MEREGGAHIFMHDFVRCLRMWSRMRKESIDSPNVALICAVIEAELVYDGFRLEFVFKLTKPRHGNIGTCVVIITKLSDHGFWCYISTSPPPPQRKLHIDHTT